MQRFAALLVLALGCSCSRLGRAGTAEGVPPTSPFLASAQYPYSIVRLSTSSSEDLRQASYVLTPEGLRIAAILRNFGQRSEGRLDLHRLVLLDPERGEMQDEPVSGEPIALWHSATHKACVVGRLNGTGSGGYSSTDFELVHVPSPRSGANAAQPVLGEAIWPAKVTDSMDVLGLGVRGVRIAAGTAEVELDYSAGIRSARAVADEGPLFAATDCPDGRLSATWAVSSDQSSGWTVVYSIQMRSNTAKPLASWTEAFPGVAGLVPQLSWVDAGHLAWQAYVPIKGPDGSEYWLERLICGELSTGSQFVIADHLPRRAGWANDYAGVFYALHSSEIAAGVQVWEAWAASADGLKKRLIWRGPALRLEVCDALDGQRVLLHRQYLAESGSDKLLHSELIEITLLEPKGGSLKLGVDPLPRVPEADSDAAVPAAEVPKPESSESAPQDQDGGEGSEDGDSEDGGGFIPDDPAPAEPMPSPSEPGKPPPIG